MFKNKSVIWVSICALIFGVSLGLSVYAYNWQRNFWANEKTFSTIEYATPEPVAGTTRNPNAGFVLPKPWDGKERLNILVMGIDQRSGESEPGYRTDTMIVFTIDPITKQAGMLSVPRDTWVQIPAGVKEFEFNRINVANQVGDAYDYPGGGPALAKKTVEGFLGITIHHTVRMNFTAFESIIDRIGGVEIDVADDIYDPEYPTSNFGVEVFKLNAGKQTLDGATALKYARTRHNLKNGDFDRARHQQQVILAVKEKISKPQTLASLVSQAPGLLNELSESVKTDMTLEQMQGLTALAVQIDRGNIKSAVLDQNYTQLTFTTQGWAVQVPIRNKISELRDSFFSSSAAGSDAGANN